MADQLVQIADGFWNIRGSFKIAGIVDIGTQASLVRLDDNRFVLLDSYTLSDDVKDQIWALTDGGKAIEAVLNLHPFHTIHVKRIHQQLPHARHYGTARHHQKAPELTWQPEVTESPEFAALFAEHFDFTVPRGVHFVPDNPNHHFASVLALHKPTGVLHVDDTLTFTRLPFIGGLSFHPTLAKVLEERQGAVTDFRAWVDELLGLCEHVQHICPAHMRSLPTTDTSAVQQVRTALGKVEKTLDAHQKRWG